MEIVLNERAWAEDMLRKHSLGKNPYEVLLRVAKYYLAEGASKREMRDKLESFFMECEPNASTVLWSGVIDSAAKNALKYPLIMIDKIDISDKEMSVIESLPGKQLQRLAFVLLCISKYRYIVNPNTDYWVNTPDKEIMKMANISTSVKRQSLLYNQLMNLGLIRFSKKIDNLSVQVLFAEDGNTAMSIDDFRNLGYQLMMHYGEPFYKCERCGLVTKIPDPVKGLKKKYCTECASKVHTEQKVNSVMRKRNLEAPTEC